MMTAARSESGVVTHLDGPEGAAPIAEMATTRKQYLDGDGMRQEVRESERVRMCVLFAPYKPMKLRRHDAGGLADAATTATSQSRTGRQRIAQ